MKKMFARTTLASLLLIGAGTAMADAPSVTLQVTGTFTVPGCTVAQSGGGTYDFGSISPSVIQSSAETALDEQVQTWTATCDADTFMSFQVIDNRASTSSNVQPTHFGLGPVNNTGKLGYYSVALSNARVDNGTAYVYSAAPGSTSVTGEAKVHVNSSEMQGWAAQSGAGSAQKAGKVFAVDMAVKPHLATSEAMNGPVTGQVPLDGSLTINYAFGL